MLIRSSLHDNRSLITIYKFTSVFHVIDSCSDHQVASEDVAGRKVEEGKSVVLIWYCSSMMK